MKDINNNNLRVIYLKDIDNDKIIEELDSKDKHINYWIESPKETLTITETLYNNLSSRYNNFPKHLSYPTRQKLFFNKLNEYSVLQSGNYKELKKEIEDLNFKYESETQKEEIRDFAIAYLGYNSKTANLLENIEVDKSILDEFVEEMENAFLGD